jgi:hypothetical protein
VAQAGVVLGPVHHSVPLLRNVVTARGIGLEGHGGYLRSGRERTSYCTRIQVPNGSFVQQRDASSDAAESKIPLEGGGHVLRSMIMSNRELILPH